VAGAALDEADIQNQPADVRFVAASLVVGQLSGRIDPARIGVAGHSDGAETALAVGVERGLPVRAVIALAVSPLLSAGPVAAPLPLLVGQGDHDTVNPPDLGQAVFNQAGRPRYLLHLVGAGHSPPFTGAAPWQSVVDHVTVDFFDRYVAGRDVSAAAIVMDGTQPGVASIDASP